LLLTSFVVHVDNIDIDIVAAAPVVVCSSRRLLFIICVLTVTPLFFLSTSDFKILNCSSVRGKIHDLRACAESEGAVAAAAAVAVATATATDAAVEELVVVVVYTFPFLLLLLLPSCCSAAAAAASLSLLLHRSLSFPMLVLCVRGPFVVCCRPYWLWRFGF
jgi:hypothetical protein